MMLGIDTSCGITSIALFNEQGVLFDHYLSNEKNNQSKELAVTVMDLLRNHNVNFDSIQKLFVCTGPGSFTGVRVGCAFVAGIISSRPEIQAFGFTALELIAAAVNIAQEHDVVCKAGPHSFYKQKFYGLEAIGEIEVLNVNDCDVAGSTPDAKYCYAVYKFYKSIGVDKSPITPIYALPSYY